MTKKKQHKSLFFRVFSYVKPYKMIFTCTAIGGILLALVSAIRPKMIATAVDDYIAVSNFEALNNYILIIGAVLMLEVILQFLFMYYASWLGQHIVKNIRGQVFHHVLRFNLKYLENIAIGRMVTRVVTDVETIAQFFGQGLFLIVSDALKMFGVAVFMVITNWKLALISFAVLPILLYATRIFQSLTQKTFQQVRQQVSNLNGFVQERITGMKIVQIFAREHAEYEKFKKINKEHRKAHIKTVWYFSIFFPVTEILSSVAIGLVVWYGGLTVALEGTVTLGEVISFLMMVEMLFRPLRQIADKFTTVQMGMVAADRVFEVLDTQSHIENKGTLTPNTLAGHIVFDKVHFAYLPEEPVLRGLSFEMMPQKTYAIVGATGAGKSTIINLINRFYEIDGGTIAIDGNNIKDYPLSYLRKKVVVVMQDVLLFSDTIYNNIVLYNHDISLEEVQRSAKEIGIHDFIMKLPRDYHYQVKERGQMLSAGQRQLIAFLRAYVIKPPILILDEATATVDPETEKLIQYATEKITCNRTVIIIAHRLETIKKAFCILVLEKGEMVEQGNHKELINKENGVYRGLYEGG